MTTIKKIRKKQTDDIFKKAKFAGDPYCHCLCDGACTVFCFGEETGWAFMIGVYDPWYDAGTWGTF